ncbi:MAG: flippase-like domain-containing protein [Kiritimatiellae bacterium]|nr:flippase-like domain-containing protein [Kiritimatiellia bacterium]
MKKKLLPLFQLILGITVVLWLLWGINRTSVLVEFNIPPSSIAKNTIYTYSGDKPMRFIAQKTVQNSSVLQALRISGTEQVIPDTGTLTQENAENPLTIQWTSIKTRPYGRQLIYNTVMATGSQWPMLLAGVAGFFVCICLCVLRWKVLLNAQGLFFSFKHMLAMYFVGQFFNSFLPGGLSGDVVKAYYVTKEAPEKRTEAASTVFIDRVFGLIALVLLTVTIMLIRLPFFLSDPKMRVAIVFNVLLLLGTSTGLFIVFRKNLFEQWSLFRRIRQKTAVGDIINRIYNAFQVCLKHPGLLAKTLLLSLGNHLILIGGTIFCLGTALGISLSSFDYLTVFPLINAVAAIPITPGGLGTREGAAVYLLGALEVPEAKAIVLSLLIYTTMLVWSMVGGIVYLLYPKKD